jgi:hypothetical protein
MSQENAMIMHKRILAAGAVLLTAVALAGCGGGGSDDGNNVSQVSNPGASDAFFTRVLALIGNSADNAEPVAIDDVAVTMPNDIEPAPL